MRILITGGRGQLGRAFASLAGQHELMVMGRRDLDVSKLEARDRVAELRPDLVVNAAAYTDVDGCEADPDRAYRINALGARNLALGSEKAGAALVQVSTDYVFDGRKGEPYSEFDETAPISVYGASKRAGEIEAARICRRTFVARTAWLFGAGGSNFVTRMLELAEERPQLEVVQNEVGCPTHCADLARAILALAETDAYGTYHLVSEGWCSRYAFARAILDAAGKPDYPIIPVDHFSRSAATPAFAPLRNFSAAELGIRLPAWQDALANFLASHIERA
jgi:dTDP-4-dehydrorhamnose reductase